MNFIEWMIFCLTIIFGSFAIAEVLQVVIIKRIAKKSDGRLENMENRVNKLFDDLYDDDGNLTIKIQLNADQIGAAIKENMPNIPAITTRVISEIKAEISEFKESIPDLSKINLSDQIKEFFLELDKDEELQANFAGLFQAVAHHFIAYLEKSFETPTGDPNSPGTALTIPGGDIAGMAKSVLGIELPPWISGIIQLMQKKGIQPQQQPKNVTPGDGGIFK